jgi:hypothetical protein
VSHGDRADLLEEELLLVRHSGEIPEVALHASLHYLREAESGPRLQLTPDEINLLEQEALARYREIILRDLDLANRDLPLFRGVRRANHNWYRFVRFSDKIGAPYGEFRRIASEALVAYLRQELAEVEPGLRPPSINCSAAALLTFVLAMSIDLARLPDNWRYLCEKEG